MAVLVCGCLAPATACTHVRHGEAAGGRGAAFEAGMVRCADVNQPTRLANCGMDPLEKGTAEVTDEGEVEVRVVRASPNVTYEVIYRSLNGTAQRALGGLMTDGSGNGLLSVDDSFLRGHVGSSGRP